MRFFRDLAAAFTVSSLLFFFSADVLAAEVPLPRKHLLYSNGNLVIVSIDTLRRDHVGVYDYAGDTSPIVDRFAQEAIFFEDAYTASSRTTEAHMSLFTSLYPSVHGGYSADYNETEIERLSDTILTFATILRQARWVTAGFHAGGQMVPRFGFDRGFGRYQNQNFPVKDSFDAIALHTRRIAKKMRVFLIDLAPTFLKSVGQAVKSEDLRFALQNFGATAEIYDLTRDPGEQRNLGLDDADSPSLLAELPRRTLHNDQLRQSLVPLRAEKKVKLDTKTINELKSRGYIK